MKLFIVISSIIVAVSLTACGGGGNDDQPTVPTTPTTPTEQVVDICLAEQQLMNCLQQYSNTKQSITTIEVCNKAAAGKPVRPSNEVAANCSSKI